MKDVAGLLLDITCKGGKKKKYLLKSGKTIIGRLPACDIVLIEDDVSRRHTQIELSEDGCTIMDLGSANGTFLDNVPLPPRKALSISPGQAVRIAGFQFDVKAYRAGETAESGKIILHPEMEVQPQDVPALNADKTVFGKFTFGLPQAPAIPKCYLIYSDKEDSWQSIPLSDGDYIIGRELDCDIQIKSIGISRQHAKVTVEGENFWITDLKSSNGVILNGEKIEAEKPHRVTIGSIFMIYKLPFLLSRNAQVEPSQKGELSGFLTEVVAAPALDMALSLSRVQTHRARFRLHTRSVKQSEAQLQKLVRGWKSLPAINSP